MSDKALMIEKIPASGLVRVRWDGGGEVPGELGGMYTSYLDAKRAITVWMAQNRQVDIKVQEEDEAKPLLKRPRTFKAIDE